MMPTMSAGRGATALVRDSSKTRSIMPAAYTERTMLSIVRVYRAWLATIAEPHLYKGDWYAVVRIAENVLPAAWEIREWTAVLSSSSWLAIGFLNLGRWPDAQRMLDRVFTEIPLRAFSAAGMRRG